MTMNTEYIRRSFDQLNTKVLRFALNLILGRLHIQIFDLLSFPNVIFRSYILIFTFARNIIHLTEISPMMK